MVEIIEILRDNIHEHNVESAKLKFMRKTNVMNKNDIIYEEDEEYEDSFLEEDKK